MKGIFEKNMCFEFVTRINTRDYINGIYGIKIGRFCKNFVSCLENLNFKQNLEKYLIFDLQLKLNEIMPEHMYN